MEKERNTVYDRIGENYTGRRREDPRIARAIWEALGDAASVLNVGAGAGSYEPRDRRVVAVEPPATMIAQRPADAAPAIQAFAEELPFDDDEFDAALAVLTIHHWNERDRGLAELRRVARERVVLFIRDPGPCHRWWLYDYFPATERLVASRETRLEQLAAVLATSRLSRFRFRPTAATASRPPSGGGHTPTSTRERSRPCPRSR